MAMLAIILLKVVVFIHSFFSVLIKKIATSSFLLSF